ncbi:hypothetical protein ID866_371 [Astraeus odoratus]|nr:hypothetical protein ID866_371 [Astraeus odoratus]
MSLDTQGILAAITIAVYVPIFILALRTAIKYGLTQKGWILLVIFTLIRVVGGALLVATEEIRPVVTGLYIGGYALEASGLSPLLLCTLALLHTTTQTPEGHLRHDFVFRLLHILGTTALVLTIIGISQTSESSQSSAETMRRIGVLLFAALFVILVAITIAQWIRQKEVMKYRKQLLLAVSAALPFLAVRTLYSVLSTFSSSTFITTSSTPTSSSDSDLAEFNMLTGEWQIFVAMDMVMELVTALIYTIAGIILKLDQDYKLQEYDEYPLYRPQY